VRAIQIPNRARAAKLIAMNKQASRKEKHLFGKKKRQLDDQALIEIERHRTPANFISA
jgi:hypothetical protein